MGEVVAKRLALLIRLACGRLKGEHDIAEQQWRPRRERRLGIPGREGEYVGRLVAAAPVTVEPLLYGIIGEPDGELDSGLLLNAEARLAARQSKAGGTAGEVFDGWAHLSPSGAGRGNVDYRGQFSHGSAARAARSRAS